MRGRGSLALTAFLFLVGITLTAGEGELPGASIDWKTIRLSPRELTEEMARVMEYPPAPTLADLVSSWKERLGNRTFSPSPPPTAEEMAVLECFMQSERFDRLNGFLEGEDVSPKRSAALMAQGKVLASALNRLPKECVLDGKPVYRGLQLADPTLARYRPGQEIVEHSFSLAYPSFAAAERATIGATTRGRHPVVVAITSRTGRSPTLAGHERKVFLLPETRFRVVGQTRRRDVTVISLEEVPTSQHR